MVADVTVAPAVSATHRSIPIAPLAHAGVDRLGERDTSAVARENASAQLIPGADVERVEGCRPHSADRRHGAVQRRVGEVSRERTKPP